MEIRQHAHAIDHANCNIYLFINFAIIRTQ